VEFKGCGRPGAQQVGNGANEVNNVVCSWRNVSYTYPGQSTPSIQTINLDIHQGELVVLIGESGSGKSTLVRTLNRLIPDFHGGTLQGSILVKGKSVRHWEHSALAAEVGFVFQDPERQLVMTEVELEVAFGLENLGVPADRMKRRVKEVLAYFGLANLRQRNTSTLSGGEKQRLAIASVMALQPDILILDEPTSQLDPTAAEEVLHLVQLLHRDLGITVILVEQRLDRCLHLADRVIVMKAGQIAFDGSVDAYSEWAGHTNETILIPNVARPFLNHGETGRRNGRIPTTVAQAKAKIHSELAPLQTTDLQLQTVSSGSVPSESLSAKSIAKWPKGWNLFSRFRSNADSKLPVLKLEQVTVGDPGRPNILRDVSFNVWPGEIVSIIGPNGAGKSTLLRSIVCLQPLSKGTLSIQGMPHSQFQPEDMAGWVGYLSQNPGDYLFQETLWEEVLFSLETAAPHHRKRSSWAWSKEQAEELLKRFGMWKYREHNPRELSGGERQRAAIAAVWVQNPVLLLLDEPTRGMDAHMKTVLGEMIREFSDSGKAVVLVTHDLDFAAEISHRIVFLLEGRVIAFGTPQEVFTQGLFYTTQIHRIFREWSEEIVTVEQARTWLRELGGEA
jgi:energy-coupling factor transporter ATP-binding protein EcfA2